MASKIILIISWYWEHQTFICVILILLTAFNIWMWRDCKRSLDKAIDKVDKELETKDE